MKIRYQVLSVLSLLSVITFLDRIAIGVAGPQIMDDLHLSKENWGWVLGIFSLAYGAFEIPTGLMGDRLGAKKVLIRVVLWWSFFTVTTGLANGFLMLLAVRFLFGIGEAGAYPNSSIALVKWFPANERARGQATIWSASRIGGALTPLIIAPIQLLYGWRVSFYFLGTLGVLWVIFWAFWYKEEPSQHPSIDKNELDEILSNRQLTATNQHQFSGKMFRNQSLLLLMAMYFCYASGAFFFQSWLSTYLQKGWLLSPSQSTAIVFTSFLLAAFSCLAGGFVCDYLAKTMGTKKARMWVGMSGLCLSGIFLLIAISLTNKDLAIIFLGISLSLMDFTIPASWATAMDLGSNRAGTVTGAMNTAGLLGSTLSTISFGYVVTAFGGNYNAPVFILAAMLLMGGIFWLKIDPSKTVEF